jgi:DNA-binding XRE family transcriptional regulator
MRGMSKMNGGFNKKEQEWVEFTYAPSKYKKTTLGMYFRYVRKKRKLTTSEVGRLTGLHPAAITQIETGKTQNPTIRLVYKIGKALEVDVGTLTKVLEKDYA